jgi:phage terminase large subunit-like protein
LRNCVPSKKKTVKGWPPRWLTSVSDLELQKSKGPQVSEFIDSMCIQTKDTIAGQAGQLLVLRDWQKELLNHIFAVRKDGKLKHRTALVGMPRKNGKSALGSGIGLWSLFMGVAGGEIYSCAADKDQAKIVFGDAKRMIEAEPNYKNTQMSIETQLKFLVLVQFTARYHLKHLQKKDYHQLW